MSKTILTIGLLLSLFSLPALAQDKPADNMQILREKIKADKKLLVAANMELTESEAKTSGRSTRTIRRICKRLTSVWEACCRAMRRTIRTKQ